jgi:hypothetical protein
VRLRAIFRLTVEYFEDRNLMDSLIIDKFSAGWFIWKWVDEVNPIQDYINLFWPNL